MDNIPLNGLIISITKYKIDIKLYIFKCHWS